MTHQEKRAWILLVTAIAGYLAYAVVIVVRAQHSALTDVPYAGPLLIAVGSSIAASILAELALGVLRPRDSREQDVRDREITRLGDSFGQAFVVIGAVAALLLTMAGGDRFWIANAIYLGFALSAVVSSFAKIAMYRGGTPTW
jgi:fermentation-respiration switch protein FrsA (DUF1100 family)